MTAGIIEHLDPVLGVELLAPEALRLSVLRVATPFVVRLFRLEFHNRDALAVVRMEGFDGDEPGDRSHERVHPFGPCAVFVFVLTPQT